MHLVSRVDKSRMLDVRQHLVLPVTKCLILCAALECSAAGVIGYLRNGDTTKLFAILMLALLIIASYYCFEVVLALSKFKRMQVLCEKDVLNVYVHFDETCIRVVGLDNREICQLVYSDCRYRETDVYAVVTAAWLVFIFDKKQADCVKLRPYLKKRGVR